MCPEPSRIGKGYEFSQGGIGRDTFEQERLQHNVYKFLYVTCSFTLTCNGDAHISVQQVDVPAQGDPSLQHPGVGSLRDLETSFVLVSGWMES